MELKRHARYELPWPIEAVFDMAVDCQGLPRYLHALGPIPGVRRAHMVDDQPPAMGAKREVIFSDGSTMLEEILAFDRPTRHCYRWLKPPAPPFNRLVRSACSDVRFTPTAAGARVDWSYRFELTSPWISPIALLAAMLMQRWMQTGLQRLPEALARTPLR